MAKAGTGFHHCITAVETAAGRDLREEELERLFSRLQGRTRRYVSSGMSETDSLVRAGRELGDDIRLAGVIEKRNKLINVARRREIEGKLTPGNEAKELRALINQTDDVAHGLTSELFGPMVHALRKEGLEKVLRAGDPDFDRAVIRELWNVTTGGKAGKNPQARRVAEIIHEAQERARTMQNAAGAWIGKLEHYVTRQSHDMDLVRGNGTPEAFAKWRDFILPRLDERTFDSLDDLTPASVDAFMMRTWNAIASGVHDTSRGRVAWGDVGAGTGPGNLAKRASAERTLLFRDADAWADYNQTFGRGTLMDAVRGGLENGAKNTALMRTWGPNPEAMHETVTAAAEVRARDRSDFKAVDALKAKTNERYFSILTSASAVDANMKAPMTGLTYGQITAGAQALQTLSKLGGVVLASVPDFAVNASVLRHNGVGLFESYFNQVTSLLPKGAARREVGDLAAAGIDGFLGNVASRFSGQDAVRGNSARLVDLFHKMNLLEWWTQSLKRGVGTMLSHNLGRLADRGFDALPERLRTTLGRYDITAADWDAARVSAAKAGDGRVYLLAAHMDDPALRSKFHTYTAAQTRDAMTEPTLFARNAQTWGTQAGTPEGMAARLIMQFKTYPITFMNRAYNREIKNAGNGMDVAGIAHLIVATSLVGYVSLELKNLARGREPKTANADGFGDYAKLVSQAIVQGGGLGFYGDFLFGEARRGSGGPVSNLFGPTIGTLDGFFGLLQTATGAGLRQDEKDQRTLLPDAIRFAQANTPFVNLFYARWALDQMIWYRLQEAANPGYLARYEERMKREHDTTFMLSPTVSPYR